MSQPVLTEYNFLVLLFWIGVGGFLALGDKRATRWLFVGASAYLVSVLYWRTGLPEPAVYSGVIDFLVIVALWRWALQRWEALLMAAFMLCLALNLIYALGMSPSYEHTVALEVINILAALFVGGSSVVRKDGDYADNWLLTPWRTVFGRLRAVYRDY